jgi:hypothetical protein
MKIIAKLSQHLHESIAVKTEIRCKKCNTLRVMWPSGLVDTCNQCGDCGYMSIRGEIINFLEKIEGVR